MVELDEDDGSGDGARDAMVDCEEDGGGGAVVFRGLCERHLERVSGGLWEAMLRCTARYDSADDIGKLSCSTSRAGGHRTCR